MNWEKIEGQWKQFAGAARERWGKLTDDDLKQIDGHREHLAGKIQERYGTAKETAEREIDQFCSDLKATL